MGERCKTAECDEPEAKQQLPVPLKLGLPLQRKRVGNRVEPTPARRQIERARLGVRVRFSSRRLGEEMVEALHQESWPLGCSRERCRITIELPSEIDQSLEVLPGLELTPVGPCQLGGFVLDVAAQDIADENGENPPDPPDHPAPISPDHRASPGTDDDPIGLLPILHARCLHLDDRPDLGSIEACTGRAADRERDPVALERDHFGRPARSDVFPVTIPKCEQDVTMLGNKNADCPILFGALLGVRANKLERSAVQRHQRRRDSFCE
jgi:hypothetical protein